jgi:arsenate reductase
MILYGLKTCDTCRKALKSLGDAEFRDVRADGLPENVARAAHERFGAALVNRQSATWRGLNEAERAGDPLALIAAHPALMKRPLIEAGGNLYLGWGKDVQAALLGDG